MAAFAAVVLISLPGTVAAQVGSDEASDLLTDLREAEDPVAADRAERALRLEWAQSGSASADLLLKRGRDALEVGQTDAAIEHLTALTDHAPDFAEGWFALATAYYTEELFGPAARALERTLVLNPDHYGALQGIGAIHDQLDRPRKAYAAYSAAAAIRPYNDELTEALDRLAREAQGWQL
ncbi:tetratricopeptide repeat protein [Roseivivax marinus]|uniref:tetratricopeptide repeat protein n=1 Tax=Roseivivax marinus TaxID=1379903 RepID=UPI0005C1693B|nr:tetratricopeptide repeat protein [Roseivivax marinus]